MAGVVWVPDIVTSGFEALSCAGSGVGSLVSSLSEVLFSSSVSVLLSESDSFVENLLVLAVDAAGRLYTTHLFVTGSGVIR